MACNVTIKHILLFLVSLLISGGTVQGANALSKTGDFLEGAKSSQIAEQRAENGVVDGEAQHALLRRSVNATRFGVVVPIDWNQVTDSIIKQISKDIVKGGKNVLALPDMRSEFELDFGLLNLSGIFQAQQGTLRSLASFRRTADVALSHPTVNLTSLLLTCNCDFINQTIKYEHFEVHYNENVGPGPTGSFEGTIDSISTTFSFFGYETDDLGCVASLQEVKITDIGNINVSVRGLGLFNLPISNIFSTFIQQKKTEIESRIERIVKDEIKAITDQYDCVEFQSLYF